MFQYTSLALTLALSAAALPALAAPPTQDIAGIVFNVTTDSDYNNPINPYGYVNVTDTPYVGTFVGAWEWIAGRAEFRLDDLHPVSNATFSFVLTKVFGSYWVPYSGASMVVDTYKADGVAAVRDFTPERTSHLGSFAFAAAPFGTVVSYDVTQVLNDAIKRGDTAFGVAMDQMSYPGQFATLGSFKLTVTPAIPEPGTYALLLGGLALIGTARTRLHLAKASR